MAEVQDVDPRNQYTAAGGETDFDFTFLVYSDAAGQGSYLKVKRTRSGTTTTLTEATDYTISGLDTTGGGTITLTSAAVADDVYTLYRDLPVKTFFTFATAGDYFATDVNKQGNLFLQLLQQLRMYIRRGMIVPIEAEISTLELPLPESFKFLRWNEAATALENVDSPSSTSSGLVSISANDTASGYLNGKLVAGTGATLTEGNDGGNETLTVAVDVGTTTGKIVQLEDEGGSPGLPAVVFNMEDKQLTRPEIKDYAETVVAHGAMGATEDFNLEQGNVHSGTLDANCTFTFSNPPVTTKGGSLTVIVTQDGTGNWAITWPASVVWDSGTPPSITQTAGATDVYSFLTVDGGTTWFGFVGGKNFS